MIGFVSQWWLRTHRPGWFKKYNYLLSAALDGGSQVIIFILVRTSFCHTTYPHSYGYSRQSFAVFGASGKAVDFPYWWGNPDPSVLSVDRCKPT